MAPPPPSVPSDIGMLTALSDDQRSSWERDGFFRIDGFAPATVGDAMQDRVIEWARLAADEVDIEPALVTLEQQADLDRPAPPEDRVSKIFRVARDPAFASFAADPGVLAIVAGLLATTEISCFLSQFIFKNPGAWGQPWHQDSYYFPFDPPRPVVGVWLAVTEATLDNGCLHVLPGSHREPLHAHGPDRRPGANYGYTEIIDHDMSRSVPVLMHPGDLLVFDSHLMHRSTDNTSSGRRAAMVYHYARTGTVDHTEAALGYTINDWIPLGP